MTTAVADGRQAGHRRRWPADVDAAKIDAAVDAAFADPAALTAAFIVVHKGRILGERYMAGITKDTQLESWSMGKSLAATLFALLVKDGTYTLEQPAPVPLWQKDPNDPRAKIRNMDLLRMSARPEVPRQPGSGVATTVSRSLLHLYRRHRRVRVFDHAPAGVPAEHRRPVPQQRSADDHLSREARGDQARRELPDVAAARAVRPDRHPPAGARDRSATATF